LGPGSNIWNSLGNQCPHLNVRIILSSQAVQNQTADQRHMVWSLSSSPF
jgi:hypothetical protein